MAQQLQEVQHGELSFFSSFVLSETRDRKREREREKGPVMF